MSCNCWTRSDAPRDDYYTPIGMHNHQPARAGDELVVLSKAGNKPVNLALTQDGLAVVKSKKGEHESEHRSRRSSPADLLLLSPSPPCRPRASLSPRIAPFAQIVQPCVREGHPAATQAEAQPFHPSNSFVHLDPLDPLPQPALCSLERSFFEQQVDTVTRDHCRRACAAREGQGELASQTLGPEGSRLRQPCGDWRRSTSCRRCRRLEWRERAGESRAVVSRSCGTSICRFVFLFLAR